MLKYHPRTFWAHTHTGPHQNCLHLQLAVVLSFFISCRSGCYLLWLIRCHQHWWVISIQWFIYCHFASMFISRLYFHSVVLICLVCCLFTFLPFVTDVVALHFAQSAYCDVPFAQHRLQTLPFWFDIVSLINGPSAIQFSVHFGKITNKTNQIGTNRQTPFCFEIVDGRHRRSACNRKKNSERLARFPAAWIRKRNKRPLQYLYNLLMSLCVNGFILRIAAARGIAESLLFPFNL